jgi:hypothetical protein
MYVQHMSMWLDVKILMATIVTLGGKKPVPSSWLARPQVAASEELGMGTRRKPAPEQVATT